MNIDTDYSRMLIDGDFVIAESRETMDVINPSTAKRIEKVPKASSNELAWAIDSALDSFNRGVWANLPPSDRSRLILKVADMIEGELEEIAKLESTNSGKTIRQCLEYDIPYSIDNIRFLAGALRVQEGVAMGDYVSDGTSSVRREPIGVIGVITPWNYPLMMAVWRAIPALAAGNSVVLKPASYTPLSTILLGKLFQKAGLPRGVLNIVTGPGSQIGEELAKSKKVDMIAFTGSEEVGRRLSQLSAPTIKKVSLELGGKAPFIVFDDANIEAAATGAVVGGIVNNGEDCANSTRYYIQNNVKDKFLKALIHILKKVRMGDPKDRDSDMGPLISASHRERVESYIEKGIKEGGKLMLSGKREEGSDGFYLSPSLIYTENEDSSIVKEEIFGPVFTVLGFDDYEDVIERSNNVIYGLGSSVWTKDVTKAIRATRDLRFGTVWVNEHVTVPSEMPWAGYKRSGHGASLSKYSIEEFQYIKHVYFDRTGEINKNWYSTFISNKD